MKSSINKKDINVKELATQLKKNLNEDFRSLQQELQKHHKEIQQIVSPVQLKKIFEELLSEKNKKIKNSDSKLQQYDGLLADAADQIIDLKKELDEIKKKHTKDYDLINEAYTQEKTHLKDRIIDLKGKEVALNKKLNLKDQEKETELREQKNKHQSVLNTLNQMVNKYKGIEDELNKDVNIIIGYFGEELYEHSLKKPDRPGEMPAKYKIIKIISYLLDGLEEIGGNSKIERIFTDSFETNIALYISSLLVKFGTDDEKIKDVISKVNERLKKLNIIEPDPEGHSIQDDQHERANPGGGFVIKEYHTLAISKKEGNKIVRKALVQS